MDRSLKDKVEEGSTVYFKIDRCPQPVFVWFKELAAKLSSEAGLKYPSYPLALHFLKDVVEHGSATEFIFSELRDLHKKIALLGDQEIEEEKPKIIGFGGG